MIFIKKLTMENIGALTTKREFNFSKGTNLLLGENGVGKSTLINTISMLLLNKYDGNLESCINNTKDNAFAELIFVLDGDEYKNSITLKKGKSVTSKKELYKNDIPLAEGENVSVELNKLLPPELTEYSLFCKQKGTKLTSVSDSDRRGILAQLCELDYSKQIKSKIEPKIELTKMSISDLEKKEYSLSNKEYNYGELRDVPTEVKDSDIQALVNQQELYNKYISDKEKLESLSSKLTVSLADLANKQENYSETKITSDYNLKKEEYNAQFDAEKKQIIEQNKSDRQNNTSKMDDLKQEISNVNDSLNSIKIMKFGKFDDSELINISTTITELNTQTKILKSNMVDLEKGVCPTCGGNCTDKFDSFNSQLQQLTSEVSVLSDKKTNLLKAKEEYDLKVSNNDKNKSLKESLQLKLTSLTSQLSSLEELNSISEQTLIDNMARCELSFNDKLKTLELDYQDKLNSATIILESSEKFCSDLQEQITNLGTLTPYENVESQLSDLKSKYEYYNDCISYNKAITENNLLLDQQKEKDEMELKEINSKLEDLKSTLFDLTFSKEVMLKTFPSWALDYVLESIQNEINSFIDEIYYKSLNIKFDSNKNSLKMTYSSDEEGRDLPTVKLSGAEDNLVNVGIVSTFNKRQNLDSLILDEVDHFCNNKTAESFYDALMEITSKFNQTIIITHKKEMQNRLIQNNCNVINL